MAGQHFYFDIWPANDPAGTAVGELSQAFDKGFRDPDQAIGEGKFSINRHDSQAAWCVPRAMVRVRLTTGGPFAYNDARYVFGFFIENSGDVALSSDEEGGEILTRGGRATPSYLHRALIYPNANISGHRQYWTQAKTVGDVIFKDKTVGEAFRILILNAQQRAGLLDGLTIDFTINDDSNGDPWADVSTDWRFPVGMNLLDVLSKVVSSQTYFRMTPGLLLSCYDDHPGTDLSGSVTFSRGVDLTEAADKVIDAQGFMSRALVKGQKANNELTFLQVFNTTIEAGTGRYEGFVEYQATPTTGRLTRAGNQAISRSKLQHDGPTTSGVYSDSKPYADYLPGDTVNLDIPDVYDTEDVKVAAIILSETEGGEYDVVLEFTDSPFDPMSGPDNFSSVDDRTTGPPGGGGKGCGDCPESTPFVPPVGDSATVADVVLTIGDASKIGVDRDQHYASDIAVASPSLVIGRQYRLIVDVVDNFNSPLGGYDNMNAPHVNAYYPDATPNVVGVPATNHDLSPSNTATTADGIGDHLGMSFAIGHYYPGFHWEGDWLEYVGPNAVTVDLGIGGTPISGYWGFKWVVRVRLEHRNGDTTPVDPGEGPTTPRQGQVVPETATDLPTAGVYTTNYPYVAGSLRVWVAGVLVGVTEVDNTAGTWSFLGGFDPGGATVNVQYQALNDDPTGATNAPWQPGTGTIPPVLLPPIPDDKWKQPVRVATTANVTISTALNAGDSIDGETLAEGDRVLVKNQSTTSQNGIYLAGATPTRTTDFDADAEVVGAIVYVVAGTANGGSIWVNGNTTAPVVGTDPITFTEFSGGAGASALDDLTDVVITAPADGDVVTYDTGSGLWVNAAPTGGVAGHYEVVMASGAGPFLLPDGDPQPPYPVTNEAEDDWLYAFVAD